MLRNIVNGEEHLIANDPVRPHIPFNQRVGHGREIFVLENDFSSNIDAVICVAYTNEVPTSEIDLELFAQQACQDNQHGNTAVFYTVWSYSKGAGREIVIRTAKFIKENKPVTRFVTLSPQTEMARKFHLSNGAIELQKNETTVNFEYLEV